MKQAPRIGRAIERAVEQREPTLPRDKVLLETDCPYLSPVRDALNEPARVTHTLALAASLWGVPEEAALDQLEQNFEALFGSRP